MGAVLFQTVFSSIINGIERGSLSSGVQFNALRQLSLILGSVPEGCEVSELIHAELESVSSKGREAARLDQQRLDYLLRDVSPEGVSRAPMPYERIDYVRPPIVDALKASVPVLVKAMESSPVERVARSYDELQKITALRRLSQTMPAILNSSTLRRARDRVRPQEDSPAVRYVVNRVRTEAPASRPVRLVLFNGKVVHRDGWPRLMDVLSEHFGSEVTRASLAELLSLPRTDYHFGPVAIRKEEAQPLRIGAEIRGKDDQLVGVSEMSIPSVSSEGRRWVAKVAATFLLNTRVGIGSQLLVRSARFLFERGVEAMDADTIKDAGLFYVFSGFCAERPVYEGVVREFVENVRAQGKELAEDRVREELLRPEANLLDLALFNGDQQRIGREFLDNFFQHKYLSVRFDLSPDNQSWLQLLSNLHRNNPSKRLYPLEWERLRPETRELLGENISFVGGNVPSFLTSDREHVKHLVERLTNWLQPAQMFMSYPKSLRASRYIHVKDKLEAISDVLAMLTADTTSPLFLHFRHRLDPPVEEGLTREDSKDHGNIAAGTLLSIEREGLLRLPPELKSLFEDIVSRE